VPLADPQRASDELGRAVRDCGFKGALINGDHRGRYLDDPFFSPFLECTAALGVPVYLHPTHPRQQVVDALYGLCAGGTFMFAARVGGGTSKLPFTCSASF
jgi:predicted TIM-barrel fold metal-dependent hydrolase